MSNNTAISSKEISIIQRLINESVMTDLLKNLCIKNIKKLKIIEAYECNNEHIGLIVEGQNKITDKKEKVIIDAVVGCPMLDQIHEIVYKKGSNCDKRIIIYTERLANRNEYNRMNDVVIKNLVENLNGYGTNIYLIMLEECFYEKILKYAVKAEPPENLKYNLTDLPSEARLKEVEFWEIFYCRKMECFYKPWETFKGQIHGHINFGHWFGLGGVDIYAKWTEEGMFFEAKDETEESECLEPIWNTRKFDIQALYPDAEITFFMKPGKLPKLLIKYLPTPVNCLSDASISEKKHLANEIFVGFHKFMEFMEYALDDIDNAKTDKMNESVELVKAV